VGTHLRSVFAKLGVQSRVPLANCLAGDASQTPPAHDEGHERTPPTPRSKRHGHGVSRWRQWPPDGWSTRSSAGLTVRLLR